MGGMLTPVNDRPGVLVVDDEPQILTAISDLLDGEFRVHTARDGLSALEVLAAHDIAVILSDQRMPGMTGAEFLGRARSQSDATRILVTGYSDLDALVSAVNLGQIHSYLSKPWNPLELKVVVKTAADRWRLSRSLDHERNLLRALMDNIPDAIFFKDRTLAFSRLNRPQAEMLGGTDTSDLVGMRLADIMPPEDARPIEALEQAIIEKGTAVDDVIESVALAGNPPRWFSTTKAPIRLGGEIVGLVGIARDITKRKEAEDYLKNAHDELQRAVDDRTLSLRLEVERRARAEEQAKLARDAAEAANRAKTVFLANMSHELRTPLNAILGFSELAGRVMTEADTERYGGFLDNISESAEHLLRVISDILDVSRVEIGKVMLRESPVDVADVVDSVCRLVGHAIFAKQQTLVRPEPVALPRLWADERLLKQILLNLVSNAAKFTPDHGTIRISTGLREGAMVIEVADDGIGIAKDDLPVVLQPFGQAESAISPKQEGAGLGLPLANGFVELHGGELTIDSVVGKGTRIVVTFPPGRTMQARDSDPTA